MQQLKDFFYKTKDKIGEWWKYPQPSRLHKHLLGIYTDSYDLDFTSRRLASEESARYMSANMRQAHNFRRDYDIQHWICSQVDTELMENGGMLMEFGVAGGRTLNHFARMFKNKIVYGFDCFDGLPETWTWYIRKHSFRQHTVPKVRDNCELVIGMFEDTVSKFLEIHNEPVAFIHIDCDLYSSTYCALSQLAKRMQPGTVILFDEYFNYPGWQNDEFAAWQSVVEENNIEYEYIGMVTRHQQVAIKIKSIG